MSNLGTLGIKPKEKKGNGKKLLIGERAGDLLTKAVSSIPDNRVTRGIGTGFKLADMAINRNPATRLYTKAEDFLINKGAQVAKDKLKIDPRIATLGLGMMIPGGPYGDLKKVSKLKKIASNPLLDIEAKNALNAIQAKNRTLPSRSTLSTVTSDTADKLHYGKGTKEVKATIPKELGGPKGSLTEIKGVPNKQFHHIFIKDLSAEYVERARSLVREGKALPEDVIDLDRITKKYGFGLGDYRSAGDYIDKIPHNEGHDLLIRKGIQPDAKGTGPDLMTEKSRISKYNNIKELKKDFELAVKEIAVPMREEMLDFQESWDKITPKDRSRLIELRLERGAARKKYGTSVIGKHDELDKATKAYSKHKSKVKKELYENRDRMLGQREALADLKIDRLNPPQ